MWHIGQKIVCVDGLFPSQFYEWGDLTPVEDQIYTIRKIGHGSHGLTGQIALSFLLEEIVNPDFDSSREVMFSAHRFRPLERKGIAQAGAERALERELSN